MTNVMNAFPLHNMQIGRYGRGNFATNDSQQSRSVCREILPRPGTWPRSWGNMTRMHCCAVTFSCERWSHEHVSAMSTHDEKLMWLQLHHDSPLGPTRSTSAGG